MKKRSYGVAVVSGALMVAAVTMVDVEVRQAPSQPASAAAGGNHTQPSAALAPRMLKRNELFSQGHTADVVDIQQVWAVIRVLHRLGERRRRGQPVRRRRGPQALLERQGHQIRAARRRGFVPHPYGMTRGGGCVLRGREEIRKYFGERPAAPWPGWTHHTSPNLLVKVNDDGKTAILTTTMLIASVTEKGESRVTTGGYRIMLKKAPEGWLIAEQNNFADRPRGNNRCDENGNLPRTSK